MRVEGGRIIQDASERGEATERERVRKRLIQEKWVQYGVAVLFLFGLCFLAVRAGKEFVVWVGEKRTEEVKDEEGSVKLPSVEVIDEMSGRVVKFGTETQKVSGGVSLRMLEFVAELEDEFRERGLTIVRARIPVAKVREVDVEVEGVNGVVKTSLDRNAAVTAEDAERMIRYLRMQGVEGFEYIDVRIARKGYWK